MPGDGRACASGRRKVRCRRGKRGRAFDCWPRRRDPTRATSADRRGRRAAPRRRPARIRGRADVDRRDPERQEQVEEHRLGAGALVRPERAVVEVVDELAEQWADGDGRRRVPVDRTAARMKVDRAEDGGHGCARLVHRARRDPEGAGRRQDMAVAGLGEHHEHSLGRPRELVLAVRVPLEARPGGHRERPDDRGRSPLSICRHNLAPYSFSEALASVS
jgi:hypothetical protein